MFSAIGTFMLHEILYNGKLLVTIVMLTVLSMILETLQTAFEKNNISKIAYSICYLVIIIIAINSFSVAIGYARGHIQHDQLHDGDGTASVHAARFDGQCRYGFRDIL